MASFTDKDQVSWPLQRRLRQALTTSGSSGRWQTTMREILSRSQSATSSSPGKWARPVRGRHLQTAKIGQLQLQTGAQQAVFQPDGSFATTLLNLRQIKLVPAEASATAAGQ